MFLETIQWHEKMLMILVEKKKKPNDTIRYQKVLNMVISQWLAYDNFHFSIFFSVSINYFITREKVIFEKGQIFEVCTNRWIKSKAQSKSLLDSFSVLTGNWKFGGVKSILIAIFRSRNCLQSAFILVMHQRPNKCNLEAKVGGWQRRGRWCWNREQCTSPSAGAVRKPVQTQSHRKAIAQKTS